MAIETAPVAPSPSTANRSTARADGSHRHGGHGTGRAADAGGSAGGFASLLGTFAAPEDAALPDSGLDTGDAPGLTVRKGRSQAGDAAAPDANVSSVAAALAALAAAEPPAAIAPAGPDAPGENPGAEPLATGTGLAVPGATRMAAEGTAQAADTIASVTEKPAVADIPDHGASARPGDRAMPGAPATLAARPQSAAMDASVRLSADVALHAVTVAPLDLPPSTTTLDAGAALRSAAQAAVNAGDAGDAEPKLLPAGSVAGYRNIFAQMQHALAHASAGGGAGSAGAAAGTTAASTAAGTAATSGSSRLAATASLGDGSGAGAAAEAALRLALPLAERSAEGGDGARRQGGGEERQSAAGVAVPGAGFSMAPAGAPENGFGSSGVLSATGTGSSDSGVATPEEALADKVQHWLNQKTQTAELTLDAFGGTPVDVRISLSGNEAQVAFSSDQADTRQMLGGALSDLRNMLQREGLVLTGATVNGSESRNAPSGSGSGQPRERRTGTGGVPAVAGSGGVAPAVRRAAVDGGGRALDLFV